MKRGDNFSILYTVTDGSTGLAQDLTGCTVWWTAKLSKSDADPGYFQRKTGGSGITLATQSGSTKGQFTVAIVNTNTSGLTADTDLYFDCQVKDTASEIYTLESGLLRVTLDITTSTS